jgi:hypothetical protein
VVRSLPETGKLLRQALGKIHSLAVRSGIALPADAVERRLGLEVPVRRTIYAALLPQERSARGIG